MEVLEENTPAPDPVEELLTVVSDGLCWDDIKGGSIEPRMVKMARFYEVKFITNRRVYNKVLWRQAKERTGRPPIKTRWLDSSEGSE